MKELFIQDEHIGMGIMCVRAVLSTLVILLLMRVGGVRINNRRSAMDNVILITLGSVLAKGVIGSSDLLATSVASATMIALHRIFSSLSLTNKKMERLINGKPLILFEKGTIIWTNMQKASISETELKESLHLETQQRTFTKVDYAILETNGRISFVMKDE